MELDQYDCTKMKDCLPVLKNVLHSCIGGHGTDFIALVIVLFQLGNDLLIVPEPVSFFVIWFVCLVVYSKSPWEARPFAVTIVQMISWPVFMFCCIAWGQAGLIPGLFCVGHVTRPTAPHTPSIAAEIFC